MGGRELSSLPPTLCRDITGNEYSGSEPGGKAAQLRVSVLDESIMGMITGEFCAASKLRSCVESDPSNGLANSLLAMELLRNSAFSQATASGCSSKKGGLSNDDVHACLLRLENNFDRLTLRERYFGAAALQWQSGNYRRAGALFESSLMSSPVGDPIALRLAQDCYLAAGDSISVLGCVTRCMQLSDKNSLFHGHLLAMLSVGYLENGRLLDAEETASRAISQTKGRDIHALKTLMNAFQLTGRSSETVASAEDHQEKHDGFGLQQILFNKGCALTQRGNYRGALRAFDNLIESIRRGTLEEEEGVSMGSSLVHASLLLWQISLHTNVSVARWQDIVKQWLGEGSSSTGKIAFYGGDAPPLVSLCMTMVMTGLISSSSSSSSSSLRADNISLPEGGEIEMDGTTTGLLENDSKQGNDLLSRLWKPLYAKIIPTRRGVGGGTADVGGGEAEGVISRVSENTPGDDAKLLLDLAKGFINRLPPKGEGEGEREPSPILPQLQRVEPASELFTHYSPELSAYLGSEGCEREWTMQTCGAQIETALTTFNSNLPGSEGVENTARSLNRFKRVFHRIGGTEVQRDVLAQTLIEAMLRSERWTDARLLLSERTTLTPNDAQSWRRQASVLGRMGYSELSQGAMYTSWQLGIGQGGFGGPR